MIRSVFYKLHPNKSKIDKIEALSTQFVQAVNHYIKCFLVNLPDRRTNTYIHCSSNLLKTARLEDNAAMVAWDTVKSYRETEKLQKKGRETPTYSGGLRLNAKNAVIRLSNNSFDRWLYIQPLRMELPFNLYNHKWLKGKELKDVTVLKRRSNWFVKVSYELEPVKSESQRITALDVGINQLLTSITKDGDNLSFNSFGWVKLQIKKQISKVRKLRKKVAKGSSKKLVEMERKLTEYLKNTYSRISRQMIREENPGVIIVEDLDIRNTKGKRSKELNNRVSRSGLSGIKKHIERIATENGIEYNKINPAYTSQTCPWCLNIDKDNRHNTTFKCNCCELSANADQIGAYSVLRTFLGNKKGFDKDPGRWPLEFHLGTGNDVPRALNHDPVLLCIGSG